MVLQEVVVVGASLAGIRAAEALRAGGFHGSLTVVGAEHHAPYDRPPLSKKLLTGEMELERIALQRDGGAGLDLTWSLGTPARALDLDHRVVVLDDGRELRFDGLVVATGAAPRRLHLLDGVPGVHVLRTLDDSLALRAELTGEPRRVVVVGAGFIGSEVAASARRLGHEVVILEALPVPLARGLGPVMGPVVAGLHADHGVELRLGVTVEAPVLGADGRVAGLQLAGDEVVPADVVVVGIGIVPVTRWLEGSGLAVRDGLVCDPTLRAGADGVVAAGDVVRWTDAATGFEHRAEHWTNAAEQGAHAAATLLAGPGEARPFSTVPFVWSDQYDARIQVLGTPGPDDDVEVVRGSVADRKFVALYGRHGKLTAALGLTMPRYLMPHRALLAAGASFDEALAVAAGT